MADRWPVLGSHLSIPWEGQAGSRVVFITSAPPHWACALGTLVRFLLFHPPFTSKALVTNETAVLVILMFPLRRDSGRLGQLFTARHPCPRPLSTFPELSIPKDSGVGEMAEKEGSQTARDPGQLGGASVAFADTLGSG